MGRYFPPRTTVPRRSGFYVHEVGPYFLLGRFLSDIGGIFLILLLAALLVTVVEWALPWLPWL